MLNHSQYRKKIKETKQVFMVLTDETVFEALHFTKLTASVSGDLKLNHVIFKFGPKN